MTSLSNKAAYLIVLNLVKYAIGFFVPIFLARLLTKVDYGAYQQVLLLANTSVGFMVLGIPMSIYYFYNKSTKSIDKKTLVTQSFIILNISALISVICIYFFRAHIASALNNERLIEYIPLLLPYIYCYLSSEYFFHLLITKDKYTKSVIYGVSESLFRSFLVLIAAFVFKDLVYIIAAISLYALLRYVYCLMNTSGDFVSVGTLKSNAYFKAQLIYSLPLAFTSLVGLIGRLMDKYFITINFSTTQFANYAVGAIELPLDVIFQGAVVNVLRSRLPVLVKENNYDGIRKLIKESTRKLSLIIIPVFVYLMIYAEDFVVILFTDKYLESVSIFRIYLMLTPLHIFILSVIPQSFGLTSIGLKISTATVVSNFILSLILLEYIGFMGPAISTVVTIYIGIAIYMVVVRKLIKGAISSFVPVLDILKISGLCMIILLPINYLNITNERIFDFFINGVIYIISFIGLCWYLNVFKQYEKSMLINMSRKILMIK